MLNGTVWLKLFWVGFAGLLILAWVATIFREAGTERTLLATAGMLLGVILFSVNVAALAEQILGPGGGEHH